MDERSTRMTDLMRAAPAGGLPGGGRELAAAGGGQD